MIETYVSSGQTYIDDDMYLRVMSDSSPTIVEGMAFGMHVYFRERYGHYIFACDTSYKKLRREWRYGGSTSGLCSDEMSCSEALEMTRTFTHLYCKDG